MKCRAIKKKEGKYVTCGKETTKKSINESIPKFKEILCDACLTNHIISGIIESKGEEWNCGEINPTPRCDGNWLLLGFEGLAT